MIQNRVIITMEKCEEVVNDFSDLEWPLTQNSRTRHYSTLNIPETLQNRATVTMPYNAIYWMVLSQNPITITTRCVILTSNTHSVCFFGRAPPPDPLVELIALPIAPSWLTGGLGIGGWGKGKRGSGGRDKGTGILACRLPPDFWRRSAEHLHKSRSNKRSMRLRRATVVTRSSAIAERPREASCLSEVSFNCTKRRAESFIFK